LLQVPSHNPTITCSALRCEELKRAVGIRTYGIKTLPDRDCVLNWGNFGMLSDQNKKIFFSNLDGLRFIAFMAVFLDHSGDAWTTNFLKAKNWSYHYVHFILTLAGSGVSLFFVLSGFLITYLIIKEKETNGHFNLLFFYIRRILRIWPLYYLVLLLNFTAFAWLCRYMSWQTTAYDPVQLVLFLTNFNILEIKKAGIGHHSVIHPTWSVAIEEQFYLVWPLIFFAPLKKFYKYLFLAVVLFCCVFRFIYRYDTDTLYYHTFAVFGDLALGSLCAYYAYYSKTFQNFTRSISKTYIILTYVFGVVWLFFVTEIHVSDNISFIFRIITAAFFAFMVLEQNYSDNSFYKCSNSRFLSKWGRYTYGLYLLHGPVIIFFGVFVQNVLSWFNTGYFINELIFRIAALILSMALSYLSYHYFEGIFLKLKGRFEIIKTNPSVGSL